MQIVCNNETFTRSDYNGFSILVRDKDGYVNGTKMVNDINTKTGKNKRFRNIIKYNIIIQYIDILKQYLQTDDQLIYELEQIYVDAKGTYIHPQLVNIIAMQVDIKYQFIISKIMNTLSLEDKNKIIMDYDDIQFKKQEQQFGFVYCVSNQDGIYKIGSTTDIKKRLKGLNNTSIVFDYKLLFVKQIDIQNMQKYEFCIHKQLNKYRIRPDREFFKVDDIKIIEQYFVDK